MNERIKELIEQATESKGFLTAGDIVPPLPVKEFNKEKFAELIVKECISIYDEWAIESYDPTSFSMARYNVRKHFGIV